MNNLFTLFLSFIKIGAFTFGGGYAMLPLIREEVIVKHKWITEEELLDIYAIAESTPGPIATAASTFIGHKVAGTIGAIVATVGVILPSFVIIYSLSNLLHIWNQNIWVQYAFMGMRAGILALLVRSLLSMMKSCPKTAFSYLVIGLAFILSTFTDINGILIIFLCGVIGLVYSYIHPIKEES